MAVITQYAGEQLLEYEKQHPEQNVECERQKNMILQQLETLNIIHGHAHTGNFCVAIEEGKPKVRIIDWDKAKSSGDTPR